MKFKRPSIRFGVVCKKKYSIVVTILMVLLVCIYVGIKHQVSTYKKAVKKYIGNYSADVHKHTSIIISSAEVPSEEYSKHGSALIPYIFTQTLDHFDVGTDLSFDQTFYVNDEFYKPGGPIWFVCQGEEKAAPDRISGFIKGIKNSNFLLEMVKETSGMILLVELRYFGTSLPVQSLEAESLKHFTVDQILEDFATIIRRINIEEYSAKYRKYLTTRGFRKPKWIYFGCSFSGSLGAWMRKKYPNLVDMAYVSSGPVETTEDFYYADKNVLERYPCKDKLLMAIQLLDAIFEAPYSNKYLVDECIHKYENCPASKQKVKELCQLSASNNNNNVDSSGRDDDNDDDGDDDDDDFLYLIGSVVTTLMQYNAKATEYNDHNEDTDLVSEKTEVDELCTYLADSYDSTTTLLSLLKFINLNVIERVKNTNNIKETKDIKTALYRKQMGKNLSPHGPRPWLYLTCNEVGLFFTSSKKSWTQASLKSSRINLNYYRKSCIDWFSNGTDTYNGPAVKALTKKYGGYNFIDNRTIYVDGENDTIYPATVTFNVYTNLLKGNATKADLYPNVILLKSGHHHSEIVGDVDQVSDEIRTARLKIIAMFKHWLRDQDKAR
ncbi:putative serine protease [Zancudomyces culisetae]|uniref:Putative serine protease n=1 Tax=Zancudomyces culisetae TaxID=1213189 RepID=A0A1R1PLN3_ZANCU|nr:putative serine protease [Zancudomyces culisetae]OMH81843.1 putative serine protease [Zancudomyces culisetae]|eukprot:OMH80978.1 putative serine protease [Zancudomyces culisetae]